jgi:hypothetical protein
LLEILHLQFQLEFKEYLLNLYDDDEVDDDDEVINEFDDDEVDDDELLDT